MPDNIFMRLTHEQKVEIFYSHGSDQRSQQEGGFLSFGFWLKDVVDYHQAVDALIQHVLAKENPQHKGIILNVACGYGAETLKIYEKIHPEKIIALDITDAHIQFAKQHIDSLGLSGHIQFENMDACKINFPEKTFDYVIGIEGPAHFKTRAQFLQKAFDVLKPSGVLLLTDIIVDREVANHGYYNRFMGRLCSKHWYMPEENWMSIPQLVELLKQIGFHIDKAESLGSKVYPGFSKFNIKWETVRGAIRTRGLRIGLLLTFISWLLGHVHRRKLIDYVFIRAVRP